MSFSAGEIVTIPSPIDVHVHLREPGGEVQETIYTGTRAASAGGYQAVFDMPNNPGGNETWTEERLDQKIATAREAARTSIGFYAGVNLKDPAFGEFPALVAKSAGLKLYMDHTTGNTEKHDTDSVRPVIDDWIEQSHAAGVAPPILLHARNEIGSETARYIAMSGHRVHWCHVATDLEAKRADTLYRKFPNVFTAGVTPHHLTMTSRNADFQQGWFGARMQPPLGEEVDAERLLWGYNKKSIQILETDHAPHTTERKLEVEASNPEGHTDPGCDTCFGVSGIEFVLPVMMALVQRGKVSMERLVDSLHDQPVKMLGLKKTGSATTKLLVEPFQISEDDIKSMSRNTPYVGWTGWARVLDIQNLGAPRILKYGSEI